jgi:uncharacterized protein
MARVLFFVILAVVLLSWLNKGRTREGTRRAEGRGGKRAGQAPALENMVRCAHCDVHLPQRDAVAQGEQWYCCEDHRHRGPARSEHTS